MKRKSVRKTGRSTCYFCESEGPIESHHIVPRRFGGSDSPSNLVDLCPTCHQRLEHVYGDDFYETLGVETESEPDEPVNWTWSDQLQCIRAIKTHLQELEPNQYGAVAQKDVIDATVSEGHPPELAQRMIEGLKRSGDIIDHGKAGLEGFS